MGKNLIIVIAVAAIAAAVYFYQESQKKTAEIALPGGATIEITQPE